MNTRIYMTDSDGRIANHVAFNNDNRYFSVALENGFAIYTSDACEPYMEQELKGSVRMAVMMGSSQIVGLLMTEKKLGGDRLMLWDSAKKKEVAGITTANEIRGIALTKTHIATIFDSAMVLYKHQPKMERVAQYETASNPLGLCCLGQRILVLPGRSAGQIQIVDIKTQNISIVPAHTSRLRALTLSPNEEIIATASDKGTLIRLYSSTTCARLGELRRGISPAKIYSIAFSPSSSRLAVTSDTNTLHVFEMPFAVTSDASSSGEASSTKTDSSSTGLGAFQKWGSLAKLSFAPRVFSDVYSFASATFAPGNDDHIADVVRDVDAGSISSITEPLSTRPKGLIGWLDEQVLVVVNAGSDARYERFALTEDVNGNIVCMREGWSRYLVPA